MTYSKIAFGTSILHATRQGGADPLGQRMFSAGAGNMAIGHGFGSGILRRLPQGIPFELDGHDSGRGNEDGV